jgi:DnaJ-class molecular chaperone
MNPINKSNLPKTKISSSTCPRCKGSGKVMVGDSFALKKTYNERCPVCKGNGKVQITRTIV